MELKEYQQKVLKTLNDYPDALSIQQTKAQKIQQANDLETDPDLMRPVPDYPKATWDVMKKDGQLPLARADIPFSPRRAFDLFQNSHRRR